MASLASRFRGFLPVVVDVETGGFDAKLDALLEVSAVTVRMDSEGMIHPDETISYHVKPFEGSCLNDASLDFIGVDPYHPLRIDYKEEDVLTDIFSLVHNAVKKNQCSRAILVGHNAFFDLSFMNACAKRTKIKSNPFHAFSCFDTVTLSALVYGQTVLSRACKAAGIDFDSKSAHSARYDAMKTADLFCAIVNRWRNLGGWTSNE